MARRRPAKTTAKKAAAKREDAVSRPFAALARKVAKKAAVEPPARERGPRRPAAKDDEASFAVHMRDVKPLDARRTRVSATGDAASAAAAPKQAAPPLTRTTPRAKSSARCSAPASGSSSSMTARCSRAAGSTSTLESCGACAGSHTPWMASSTSTATTRTARRPRWSGSSSAAGARGDRAVLIVHGKGRHSPRGAAVLRGELGAWLSQGVAAKDVLAFASLEDADGGSGALMVLLAKR